MENSKLKPPNLFLKFFRWFCHPKLQDSIEGDLMELYEERVKEIGCPERIMILYLQEVGDDGGGSIS